jgi:formamidopyrimidine-DNA glycosylase
MPELPEVETVRRTLERLIVGEKIEKIDIIYPPIVQMDGTQFKQAVQGQTIQAIHRMGKYLIFLLNQHALVIHLRMEGRFYLFDQDHIITKHEHLIFHLSSGKQLIYHDVRKFGTMDLLTITNYQQEEPLCRLGKEPQDIIFDDFYQTIKKRQTEIKAILLDQHVISGLGNIYVDETLFRSKIHPTRKGTSIKKDEVHRILESAKWVLGEAIKQGGTTIRTFRVMEGVHGRFQHELAVHTKVGEPCPICGTPILKIKVKGRGTYVCPTCQR